MSRILLLTILTAQFAAYAQTLVGPAEDPLRTWTTAITNGDASALAKLYPASGQLRLGNNPIGRTEELAFWADLKSRGMTLFNPRVLETKSVNGGTLVLLRISAEINGRPMVASAQQIWVKTPAGWLLAASLRSGDFVPDGTRRLPEPPRPNVNLYPEPDAAEADLKAALTKAGREHKRVLVVFGGNWCYDCHVLDTTFHSKEFAPLVDSNYVVVHINIGDEGKANGPLAARLGVVLDKGVPSLGVLDPNGKVVYAQKNGEFESTVKIGPEDVRAFLEKWKPVRA